MDELDEMINEMSKDKDVEIIQEVGKPDGDFYEKKVIKKGPGYMEMTVISSAGHQGAAGMEGPPMPDIDEILHSLFDGEDE